MATLPEEWKQKRIGGGRKRSGGGGGGGWFNSQNRFGRKRPAGGGGGNSFQPSPPKKKPEDEKIVITADNPVSCLYEYAKKVKCSVLCGHLNNNCFQKKIPDPEFDCVAENLLETWMVGTKQMKKVEFCKPIPTCLSTTLFIRLPTPFS